jgi:hypothetical protein
MRTFVPLSTCIVVFSICSLSPAHAQSPSDSLIVRGVRVSPVAECRWFPSMPSAGTVAMRSNLFQGKA